jgi:hypothetical protein
MRRVKKGEAEKFAEGHGFKHYSVSAKSGKGISDVFTELCEDIYKSRFGDEPLVTIKGRKKGVKINIEEEKRKMDDNSGKSKKGGCCGSSS